MRKTVLLLFAAMLLAGCKDSTGSSGGPAMAFSYSGPRTGQFSAPPATGTGGPDYSYGSFAYAGPWGQTGYMIMAYDSVSANRGTFLFLVLETRDTATFSLDFHECIEPRCAIMGVTFDTDMNLDNTPGDVGYSVDHGTVRVTSVTATEIRGTVEGTGGLTVSGGSFVLPIYPNHAYFDRMPPALARRVQQMEARRAALTAVK